jgi:hypothetical protein
LDWLLYGFTWVLNMSKILEITYTVRGKYLSTVPDEFNIKTLDTASVAKLLGLSESTESDSTNEFAIDFRVVTK